MTEGKEEFTTEDEEFLDDVDKTMDDATESEKNFWIMWDELEPDSKEMVVDQARSFAEEGTTPLGSDINLDFYKRLVERWDNGEFKE